MVHQIIWVIFQRTQAKEQIDVNQQKVELAKIQLYKTAAKATEHALDYATTPYTIAAPEIGILKAPIDFAEGKHKEGVADLIGAGLGATFRYLSYYLKAIPTEKTKLISELFKSGAKFNTNDIVDISKNELGKIIFLENGNSKAGLLHILTEHADDFVKSGIKKDDIAKVVMDAVTTGKQVGTTGKSRPVYEVMYNGFKKNIAVDVSNNGFVVGANPVSTYKPNPSN